MKEEEKEEDTGEDSKMGYCNICNKTTNKTYPARLANEEGGLPVCKDCYKEYRDW